MGEAIGKKTWVFPDTELPPPGDSLLKGHESLIILNMNHKAAEVILILYFTDKAPRSLGPLTVEAERVRCIRLDNEKEIGYKVPLETQYALKLKSNLPVVVQYGRLDSRQDNLAYYTTLGYSV